MTSHIDDSGLAKLLNLLSQALDLLAEEQRLRGKALDQPRVALRGSCEPAGGVHEVLRQIDGQVRAAFAAGVSEQGLIEAPPSSVVGPSEGTGAAASRATAAPVQVAEPLRAPVTTPDGLRVVTGPHPASLNKGSMS